MTAAARSAFSAASLAAPSACHTDAPCTSPSPFNSRRSRVASRAGAAAASVTTDAAKRCGGVVVVVAVTAPCSRGECCAVGLSIRRAAGLAAGAFSLTTICRWSLRRTASAAAAVGEASTGRGEAAASTAATSLAASASSSSSSLKSICSHRCASRVGGLPTGHFPCDSLCGGGASMKPPPPRRMPSPLPSRRRPPPPLLLARIADARERTSDARARISTALACISPTHACSATSRSWPLSPAGGDSTVRWCRASAGRRPRRARAGVEELWWWSSWW